MTRAIAIALVLLPLAVFAASMWEYEEAWMQAATAGGGVALPTPFIRWDAHNGAATNDQIITALASTGSDTRSLTNTTTYAGRYVANAVGGYGAIWLKRAETRFYFADSSLASWQFLHASNVTVIAVYRVLQTGHNPLLLTDDGNGGDGTIGYTLGGVNLAITHRASNGDSDSVYTFSQAPASVLTTGAWTLVSAASVPADATATNRSIITAGSARYAGNADADAPSTASPSFGFRLGQYSAYASTAPDIQFALIEIYVNLSESDKLLILAAHAAKYGVTGP